MREKYIYRFAIQDSGINELATDKLAQMAEKILEQEMREKDDAIMKEAEGLGEEIERPGLEIGVWQGLEAGIGEVGIERRRGCRRAPSTVFLYIFIYTFCVLVEHFL